MTLPQRLRPEMRLGLILVAAAILCSAVGVVADRKIWGSPLAMAGFSSLWTTLTLFLATRRVKGEPVGRISHLAAVGNSGGIAGFLGGSLASGTPQLAGALSGVVATLAIWLTANPLGRN